MNNKKITIGIINLQINNLFSIYKACINAGYKTEIVNDLKNYYKKDIILLPGVGSFKSGVDFLKKSSIDKKIYDYLDKPYSLLYGICLGMQLLFEQSEEFTNKKGLSLLKGNVCRINKNIKNIKIPHIGWSNLISLKKNFFLRRFYKKSFYFTHSYYCDPKNKDDILCLSKYNSFNFCSAVHKNKIFGTQFHPEKSGLAGVEFLKNLKNLKNYI